VIGHRAQFEEMCTQLLMKVEAPLKSVMEQSSKQQQSAQFTKESITTDVTFKSIPNMDAFVLVQSSAETRSMPLRWWEELPEPQP